MCQKALKKYFLRKPLKHIFLHETSIGKFPKAVSEERKRHSYSMHSKSSCFGPIKKKTHSTNRFLPYTYNNIIILIKFQNRPTKLHAVYTSNN